VEICFGVLAGKVLRRGNFISAEDLGEKMEMFISYFNRTMAKPYRWTYKGLPLTAFDSCSLSDLTCENESGTLLAAEWRRDVAYGFNHRNPS